MRPQNGTVTVRQAPAYVNDRCTACGKCSEVCPAKVKDPHNLGMSEVPAIRLPHPNAWPYRYTLDREACPDGCKACVEACAYDAIDLDAKEREETLEVGSVVVATGWHAYPLEKLPELGGGTLPNVISNVQMERLASASGPTGGKIQRPSDGAAPEEGRLRPVRGLPGPQPPPLLLLGLLPGLVQAGLVRPGAGPRGRGHDLLHRPPAPSGGTRSSSPASPSRRACAWSRARSATSRPARAAD